MPGVTIRRRDEFDRMPQRGPKRRDARGSDLTVIRMSAKSYDAELRFCLGHRGIEQSATQRHQEVSSANISKDHRLDYYRVGPIRKSTKRLSAPIVRHALQ